jgi:hypothetical protein
MIGIDFPPTTLIRLYEFLKNDSRSKDRTEQHTECAVRFVLSFVIGGGERDRTDDPLLAKQVLSQLSYTPSLCWWVWLDSNQRPPPYQDGALTD